MCSVLLFTQNIHTIGVVCGLRFEDSAQSAHLAKCNLPNAQCFDNCAAHITNILLHIAHLHFYVHRILQNAHVLNVHVLSNVQTFDQTCSKSV